MNREEWHRVEEWVYQALELAREQRQKMLQTLMTDHGDLGREAAELVAAHKHITHFLEPPIWNHISWRSLNLRNESSTTSSENEVLHQLALAWTQQGGKT